MFGFHPIHLFLNTDTLQRYEAVRLYFNDYGVLQSMRNAGFGVRNVLGQIIQEVF